MNLQHELERYEGLVVETARQIVRGRVELEFDDIAQILRVTVWQAVQAFDERKSQEANWVPRDKKGRTKVERFVFLCVKRKRLDIEKRPRRNDASIDEIRNRSSGTTRELSIADWFDARFLSIDAEEIFAHIDDEHELPPTLNEIERQVVALRLEGLHLFEIDRRLGLSRAQREQVMESVREKLEGIRPASEPRTAPTPPLPQAEPQPTRPRASLAA